MAEFSDLGSAQAIAGILESENVDVKINPIAYAAGVPTRYQLLAASIQVPRVRLVLQNNEFTDRELTFLATGEFLPEPE